MPPTTPPAPTSPPAPSGSSTLNASPRSSARGSRRRAADAAVERVALLRRYAGKDLSVAARVHWKDSPAFTDLTGALHALREGVTVTNHCDVLDADGQRVRRGTGSTHRLRFNPDGSITLLDHPDYVLDIDAELMLSALGGDPMVPCVAAAVHFPHSLPLPSNVTGWVSMSKRLRSLHTAVAWAQEPNHVWTPGFGDSHLRYGITPRMVQEWTEAGWAREEALLFQQEFATIEVANAWRAVGKVSARTAALAGGGEYPNEEERWTRVGFSATQSKKWRGSGMTPEQAWEWESHKVAPTQVHWLLSADARGEMALETAKEWSKAGVPTKRLLGWFAATNGHLPQALHWSSARIQPEDIAAFEDWNHQFPNRALTPRQIAPYMRAGFPRNPTSIALALADGLAPSDFTQAVNGLREGTQPDLLDALRREAVRRGEDTRNPDYSFGYFTPERDGQALWWVLRDIGNGYHPTVAQFIADWLCTEAARTARPTDPTN